MEEELGFAVGKGNSVWNIGLGMVGEWWVWDGSKVDWQTAMMEINVARKKHKNTKKQKYINNCLKKKKMNTNT